MAEIYQIISFFSTDEKKSTYDILYMIGNFSGEAIKKSSEERLKFRCPQIASSLVIPPEEQPHEYLIHHAESYPKGGEPVLIYLYPKWTDPGLLSKQLFRIQETIAEYEIKEFVALGATVSEGQEDYFLDIVDRASKGPISIPGGTLPEIDLAPQLALLSGVFYTTIEYINFDFESHVRINISSHLLDDANYFNTTHILDYVRKEISKGRKVVLFSYFEGSSIASKVMSSLSQEEREYVGSVYIAPTISSLGPGTTDYVLDQNNRFIDIIKDELENPNLNFVEPLAPKVYDSEEFKEETAFSQTYFEQMRKSIAKAIETVSESLKFKTPTVEEETIKASLEWSDSSHHYFSVDEPDGTKVSEENRQGSIGQMSQSTKRLSYVVLNKDIVPGVYRFSSSLKFGSVPSSAKLTITVGEKVFERIITHLHQEILVEFARIFVEISENGKYNIYLFESPPCPSEKIIEYANKFIGPNEAKSVLALSRYICEVFPPLFGFDVSFSESYREIFKLSECVKKFLPNDFTDVFVEIYEKQLNSTRQRQKFLEMIEFFDGSPLRTMSAEELELNCPSIIAGTYNRKITPNCLGESVENVLVYVYPTLLSPNKLLEQIHGFKQLNGVDQVIALGAQISKTSKSVFTDFLSYLSQSSDNSDDFIKAISEINDRFSLLSTMVSDKKYIKAEENSNFTSYYTIFNTHFAYNYLFKSDYFDVTAIKPFIERLLLQGKKVLLVTHGLGSNAGEELFSLFTDDQKKSIESFYIAPYLENPSHYITNNADTLLNYIEERLSFFYKIDKTFTIGNTKSSIFESKDYLFNHELLGYLQYLKTEIEGKTSSILNDLEKPIAQVTSGSFMVVVEFESSSKYELFVLQPDSNEISAGSSLGNIGKVYLSNSPHFLSYSVPCDKIAVGNYKFALQLKEGAVPNNVRITVSIGRQEEVKTFVINQRDSKTNIFSVNVQSLNTQDLKELTFEIQEL